MADHPTPPFTPEQQRAIDCRIADAIQLLLGGAAFDAWSSYCDTNPRPVTAWEPARPGAQR